MIKTWREREFEANGYVAVSPASNVIHMKAEIDELRQAIEQAKAIAMFKQLETFGAEDC